MLKKHFFTLPVRVVRPGFIGALAAALLAGCAQNPTANDAQEYVLSRDHAKPIDNATLNGFLEQAPGNGAVTVSSSPWGSNVDIVAEAEYFAASGRQCRELKVITFDQQTQQALVCRGENGWVEQRKVTQTAGSTR